MTEARALVIVDVQRDFTEGGHLAVEGGAHVAKRIAEYLHTHGLEYRVIVATKDWHPWGPEIVADGTGELHVTPFPHFSVEPDYVDSWPPHCLQNTPGAEFHPNLEPELALIDRVFYKGQEDAAYSGFEGVLDMDNDRLAILDEGWDIEGVETASLDWYLKYWGITHIDVCGLALDYCVRATAIDAADLGYHTRVLVNLTAAVNGVTTGPEALLEMGQHGVETAVVAT